MKTEEECLQYLSKLSTPKLSENEKAFAKENRYLMSVGMLLAL